VQLTEPQAILSSVIELCKQPAHAHHVQLRAASHWAAVFKLEQEELIGLCVVVSIAGGAGSGLQVRVVELQPGLPQLSDSQLIP